MSKIFEMDKKGTFEEPSKFVILGGQEQTMARLTKSGHLLRLFFSFFQVCLVLFFSRKIRTMIQFNSNIANMMWTVLS